MNCNTIQEYRLGSTLSNEEEVPYAELSGNAVAVAGPDVAGGGSKAGGSSKVFWKKEG